MKLLLTFVLTLAIGAAVALGTGIHGRASPAQAGADVRALTRDVAVSGPLTAAQLAQLGHLDYDAIIDLQPGAAAAAVADEARSVGMGFVAVPVAGDRLPEAAEAALSKALASRQGRVLLIGSTGAQAARAWSLVEASRQGGRSVAAILGCVQDSGHVADDLKGEIERRVRGRSMALVALQ